MEKYLYILLLVVSTRSREHIVFFYGQGIVMALNFLFTILKAFLVFSLVSIWGETTAALLPPVVILPLYIYPSSLSSWSTLTTSLTANPSLQILAVVNPSNGPGPGPYPNSDYMPAIASLNAQPNLQTLCYVHTMVATRPIADVMADITVCAGWATYLGADIHMDGIFFDEAPYTYTVQAASYMTQISTYARLLLGPGRNIIVFNTGHTVNGRVIDPAFFIIADYINVFENDYTEFSSNTLTSIPSGQRFKSSIMIHGFNGSAETQATIVSSLKSGGIRGIFITTQQDYNAWSVLWAQFCTAMMK